MSKIPDEGSAYKKNRVIVACRVMEPELEKVRKIEDNVEIRYLDQSLHLTPQKMAPLIQEQIDLVADYATEVVLGYGLCSNGIVDVTARRQRLIIPRCHDCIAIFLGSCAAYKKALKTRPGTYYLTAGWIDEKKDPLGIVEKDYTPRVGRDLAIWTMKEELKNYTHIVLINTEAEGKDYLRKQALENVDFFKKKYKEIPGSFNYFRKLIRGPYLVEDFFFLDPEERVTQKMFLGA